MSLFIILIYVETIGNFYLKQDYLLFFWKYVVKYIVKKMDHREIWSLSGRIS